jgi:hypothetical protein
MSAVFWVVICPKFEDENTSEKFSAEMEFCKIDPRLGAVPPKVTGFVTAVAGPPQLVSTIGKTVIGSLPCRLERKKERKIRKKDLEQGLMS